MKRAWTGERFSFQGKYYHFDNALVRPKPVSPKGPELLWGGMTPKSIELSANTRPGEFACNLGAQEIARYYEALRAQGKDPAAYSVVNTRQVYVADSADQAWEEIEPGLMYQMELYGNGLNEGAIDTAGRYRPDADALRKASILGTPKQVIEQLNDLIARSPMTELALSMQQTGTRIPSWRCALSRDSLQRYFQYCVKGDCSRNALAARRIQPPRVSDSLPFRLSCRVRTQPLSADAAAPCFPRGHTSSML